MGIARKLLITCAVLCLFAGPSHAQGNRFSAITCGVRQHVDHPSDTELPFGNGDLSYLLAYEYHEGTAFWQLGLSYTPHATSTSLASEVESVITPQLHLFFREKLFMFGLGILKHCVNEKDVSHWTGMYWQLEAGLSLPITRGIDVQAVAYYSFDDWGDIGDLDTGEIEFGVNLSYAF